MLKQVEEIHKKKSIRAENLEFKKRTNNDDDDDKKKKETDKKVKRNRRVFEKIIKRARIGKRYARLSNIYYAR